MVRRKGRQQEDFMVAAGRGKEDVLVKRKCRYEELRRGANEPICQTGGFVKGNEYSLCGFSWPRHLEKIQTSHSLSTIASSLLPVCNEG